MDELSHNGHYPLRVYGLVFSLSRGKRKKKEIKKKRSLENEVNEQSRLDEDNAMSCGVSPGGVTVGPPSRPLRMRPQQQISLLKSMLHVLSARPIQQTMPHRHHFRGGTTVSDRAVVRGRFYGFTQPKIMTKM